MTRPETEFVLEHPPITGVASGRVFEARSVADALQIVRATRGELEIAQRLLGVIEDEPAPERGAYLHALGEALQTMPDELHLEHAARLTALLLLARSTLDRDTTTFPRWREVQFAIDPTLSGFMRVPPRFVRQAPPRPAAVYAIGSEEDLRIDRLVREFWGTDGDPRDG